MRTIRQKFRHPRSGISTNRGSHYNCERSTICFFKTLEDDDYKYSAGFTVLELLIVVAIISIVSISVTGLDNLRSKKDYLVTSKDLTYELSIIRNDALSRGATTRMTLASNAGVYTITTKYYNTGTAAACNNTGGWSNLKSYTLSVPSTFQITGTGVGDVCFDRDGSSTGGVYTISQVDGGTDIGRAVITVVMATGYIDVVEN